MWNKTTCSQQASEGRAFGRRRGDDRGIPSSQKQRRRPISSASWLSLHSIAREMAGGPAPFSDIAKKARCRMRTSSYCRSLLVMCLVRISGSA
ncbi:hypothetical protein MLD38_006736 [Melastoma candidum]|uniref:Uncharacterized protein n=1 Tax=Melastoma candidum TaxID=119954 RepID=A0ACB9RNZ2_9MYRT|nr:hypothetical protein MLD38_006736 [Melastoma candidum]